jgi:hypothetical protein
MIVVAFTIACVLVFAAAFYSFARAVLIAMHLSRRANAMVPRTLLSQLRFAQIDAKRTAKSVGAIGALTPRAGMASASILASVHTYRALLARWGLA